ncbi:MAG: hypothetical protein ACRD22_08580 [Terriglobia bacterium]
MELKIRIDILIGAVVLFGWLILRNLNSLSGQIASLKREMEPERYDPELSYARWKGEADGNPERDRKERKEMRDSLLIVLIGCAMLAVVWYFLR